MAVFIQVVERMAKVGKRVISIFMILGFVLVLPLFLLLAFAARDLGEPQLLVTSLVVLGGVIVVPLGCLLGLAIWLCGLVCGRFHRRAA